MVAGEALLKGTGGLGHGTGWNFDHRLSLSLSGLFTLFISYVDQSV
jgi:hypothetical protein